MKKTTFLKVILLSTILLVSSAKSTIEAVTFFSFTGTSGYLAPPAIDWTSAGSGVASGSYLKLCPGSVTSPTYQAATSVVFKYDVASYGNGSNTNTILYILDASNNGIITQFTLASASSSTYVSNQTVNVGNVSKNFKVKIEGKGDGSSVRGTRLQNYSLTGTVVITEVTDVKIEGLSAFNGKIKFSAETGENIEVYNSTGQRIIKQKSVEGLNVIDLPNVKGIVVIKVGNKTAKVVL